MSTLWMAVSAGPQATRILAMTGASESLLKARLSPHPSHPRALATLLEAIALWQGTQVHAALVADDRATVSDSSLYREAFTDFGGPLYTLEWLPAGRRPGRRHRDIAGVGDFRDLHQTVLFEVAR